MSAWRSLLPRFVLHPECPSSYDSNQRQDRQQHRKMRTPGIKRWRIPFYLMDVKREPIFWWFLFIARCNVVGYRLLIVDSQEAGVGADKSAIENSSGKDFKLFVFQCLEPA